MKKALLFLLTVAVIATSAQAQTFFQDSLGHIKCTNCIAGDTGSVNGVVYTSVNRALLTSYLGSASAVDLSKLFTGKAPPESQ